MTYVTLKSLHLLATIAFIGTLFFQVVILWPATRNMSAEPIETARQAIKKRAQGVIHWAGLFVYGVGLALVWPYRSYLLDPFASTFSLFLSLKLLLAALILLHYVALAFLRRSGILGERGTYWLNVSVLLLAVLLVLCSKGMFLL